MSIRGNHINSNLKKPYSLDLKYRKSSIKPPEPYIILGPKRTGLITEGVNRDGGGAI